MSINPTFSSVQRNYNPCQWAYMAENTVLAYTGKCPPLSALSDIYGEGSAKLWIAQQVSALFLSSSSRDGRISAAINVFSANFAARASCYKLTELMLFFSRYQAGVYNNSYASFDPRRIGNAFFSEFLPERNRELDAIEREREDRRRREEAAASPEAVSREEYEKMRTIPVCVYFMTKNAGSIRRITERFNLKPYGVNGEADGDILKEDYGLLLELVERKLIQIRNKS